MSIVIYFAICVIAWITFFFWLDRRQSRIETKDPTSPSFFSALRVEKRQDGWWIVGFRHAPDHGPYTTEEGATIDKHICENIREARLQRGDYDIV